MINIHNKQLIEYFSLIIVIIATSLAAVYYDLFEKLYIVTRNYEDWDLDELFSAMIAMSLVMIFFYYNRFKELKIENKKRVETEELLVKTNAELSKRLEEIKILQGIIPICASCKKIRDTDGYWHQVEEYISSHTDTVFTHGLCEDCISKLYPDLKKK